MIATCNKHGGIFCYEFHTEQGLVLDDPPCPLCEVYKKMDRDLRELHNRMTLEQEDGQEVQS